MSGMCARLCAACVSGNLSSWKVFSTNESWQGPGTRINESRALVLLAVLFYILDTRLATRSNNPSSVLPKWQLVEAFGLLHGSLIGIRIGMFGMWAKVSAIIYGY